VAVPGPDTDVEGDFSWRQNEGRPLTIQFDPDHPSHVFLTLTAGDDKPGCFSKSNHFCFTSGFLIDDGDLYDAITEPRRAASVESLDATLNLAYSDDRVAFPQSNKRHVTLQNAAWTGLNIYPGTSNGLVEKLDRGPDGDFAHSSGLEHDDIDKATWWHREEFSAATSTGFANLGLRDYPPVWGVGNQKGSAPSWYWEYAGEDGPIPLVCRSVRTGKQLAAELTYHRIRVCLVMHVEMETGVTESGWHRVLADIDVELWLRVRLGWSGTRPGPHRRPGRDPVPPVGGPSDEELWRQANMLNPDDPFDLTLADSNDRLIAYGPNAERVTLVQRWTGLLSNRQFSRNEYIGDFGSCDGDPGVWCRTGNPAFRHPPRAGSCCGAIEAINNTVIYGALTDGTEFDIFSLADPVNKPQWYINADVNGVPLAGWVSLGVPDGIGSAGC
jgi:hypothetical protein